MLYHQATSYTFTKSLINIINCADCYFFFASSYSRCLSSHLLFLLRPRCNHTSPCRTRIPYSSYTYGFYISHFANPLRKHSRLRYIEPACTMTLKKGGM